MTKHRLVWSDDQGDQRKSKNSTHDVAVHESQLQLQVRRLTAGKGRTVIEITGLPKNNKWCKELAKKIKQTLGVGGTYKQGTIEVHGEKLTQVIQVLEQRSLKWKQIGG